MAVIAITKDEAPGQRRASKPLMATQWSERIRQAAKSILPPSKRREEPADLITLKQLTRGSGFGRSVQCVPGYVTVVKDDSPRAESFREALLTKSHSPIVSARVGLEELRRSEMYVVGANDFAWETKTVSEALKRAGAPERQIGSMLFRAGLGSVAGAVPKSLGGSDLKKLSILLSLHARARMLIYDRPFMGLDANSANELAKMMVERASRSKNVMLVLGENELPLAWKEDHGVMIVAPAHTKGKEEITLPTSKDAQRLVNLVRNLSQTPPPQTTATLGRSAIPAQTRGDIITRPQMIFEATRAKNPSVMNSELINNPNIPQDILDIQLARKSRGTSSTNELTEVARDSRNKPTSKAARTASGRLTEVTWRSRYRRFRSSTKVRMLVKSFTGGEAIRQPSPTGGTSGTAISVARYRLPLVAFLFAMIIIVGSLAMMLRAYTSN